LNKIKAADHTYQLSNYYQMATLPKINGNLDTVRNLIESGNVNINHKYGLDQTTLLHYTASNHHTYIIHYLIEHGADINKTDRYGYTPLHDAVNSGHIDTVELLLGYGARTDIINMFGSTPASLATKNYRYIMAEYISSYEYIPTKGVRCDG